MKRMLSRAKRYIALNFDALKVCSVSDCTNILYTSILFVCSTVLEAALLQGTHGRGR